MEKLKINTGAIHLAVECDGIESEISFNPNDVAFVEEIYKLMSELDAKSAEFAAKEAKLDENSGTDENGIPVNAIERLKLIKEACLYMRGRIDDIFGAGTSDKVFGCTNTLSMFEQFFEGITPYINRVRANKMSKYTNKTKKGVM